MYKQEKPSISNKCDDDDEKICHNHDKYEYKSFYTTTKKNEFPLFHMCVRGCVSVCATMSLLCAVWFFFVYIRLILWHFQIQRLSHTEDIFPEDLNFPVKMRKILSQEIHLNYFPFIPLEN